MPFLFSFLQDPTPGRHRNQVLLFPLKQNPSWAWARWGLKSMARRCTSQKDKSASKPSEACWDITMWRLERKLWISFSTISHFIKLFIQEIYWTPIISQALSRGTTKTDNQAPAQIVFAIQWGGDKQLTSSCIITNSQKLMKYKEF